MHGSGVARKSRVEGSVGNEMRFDPFSHLSQQLKRWRTALKALNHPSYAWAIVVLDERSSAQDRRERLAIKPRGEALRNTCDPITMN